MGTGYRERRKTVQREETVNVERRDRKCRERRQEV
jgi:hypothetical protein